MKILFIHNPDHPQFSPEYFSQQRYRFFIKALPEAAKRLGVEFIPCAMPSVDASGVDAVMLAGITPSELPVGLNLTGHHKPTYAWSNDCHKLDATARMRVEQLGIDCLFYHHPEKVYRRYWNAGVDYVQIFMHLDPEPFRRTIKWDYRHAGRILVTGVVNNLVHYKLRSMCLGSNHCIYIPRKDYFIGDKYTLLLQNYRAMVAACTTTTVNKYLEGMASGCLTFAECNDDNGWENLGLVDGANCVMINENNYQVRFDEYMRDRDNPKWHLIAKQGRSHALKFDMYSQAGKLLNYIRDRV